jgi:malate dehydrogenase
MTCFDDPPLVLLGPGVLERTWDVGTAFDDPYTVPQQTPTASPPTRPIRVAIAGAGGPAASTLIFRIAAGALFGPTQAVALSLLERVEKQAILEASATALRGGAYPLLSGVKIGCDPRQVFVGADWVILLGGDLPAGEVERIGIARVNAPTFAALGRAVNETAPWARVLVAASPCNTNCLVARSYAPDVPADHWFALTLLTQSRARALVAAKAGVPVRRVSRLTVWGNDSEAAYADLFHARVGGLPAHQVIDDPAWVRDVFFPALERRYRTIQGLDMASSAGTVAHAVLATVRSIMAPTPLGRRFGAAVVSDGSYGVPRGLIFGFPLRTEDGQSWSIVQGLRHNLYARRRLTANVAALKREAMAVADLVGNVG